MNFLKSSVNGKIWLAALGAAVAGPLLLTIADSTVMLAGGLFLYVFFLQYQAFQKQEMQKKQIAQEKMLREISFGLFNNVLEADISENRVLGENALKLSDLLGLNKSDDYEEIIDGCDLSKWDPIAPNGFFLMSINFTEDGADAVFAREIRKECEVV